MLRVMQLFLFVFLGTVFSDPLACFVFALNESFLSLTFLLLFYLSVCNFVLVFQSILYLSVFMCFLSF